VQVLAVVQAVARVPAQVLAAAPPVALVLLPVVPVQRQVLVVQPRRAALLLQVVRLLPVLVPLRRRVQLLRQPLQRLVW